MFDFGDAEPDISKEDILSKVSEYQIFKNYCSNFQEIDKSFCSEFYTDNNPGCRIYVASNNSLYYKDFGTGEHLGCFDYVQKKYSITFYECLKVIANDFNIKKLKFDISPSMIVSNDILLTHPSKPKIKSHIEIVQQNYTSTDYTYWNKFAITLQDLEEEEIFSVKQAYLIKGLNTTIFEYKKSNPIYAYKEYDYETNEFIGYKLYFPFASKGQIRFLNNSSGRNIDGYKNLPKTGDSLIITKSRKDRIILKKLGYNVISLSSEGAKVPEELMSSLAQRFKKIFLLLDNDDPGIKYSQAFCELYKEINIIPISVPPAYIGCTDIGDVTKEHGVEESQILMNKLLNTI